METDERVTHLKEKELNSLQNIRDIFKEYGPKLKEAYQQAKDDGSAEALYELARNSGFVIEEKSIGSEIINDRGQKKILNPNKPVRVGMDKTVYVGTTAGSVSDIKELTRKVGTILLSTIVPLQERSQYIRVNTFNEVAERSEGKTYTQDEFFRAKVLERPGKGSYYLAENLLFNAIVFGDIPYKAVKYA